MVNVGSKPADSITDRTTPDRMGLVLFNYNSDAKMPRGPHPEGGAVSSGPDWL